MGFSNALGVSVCSPDSSLLRSSLDGVYGGHGFRAASPLLATRRKFGPSLTAAASSSKLWRRESSFRGGRRASGFTVQASSSSDETSSGEKRPVKTENVPGWAKPNSDELPPWAKNERPASQEPAQVSFGVYLLGSTVVAIAAVGSVFEFFYKNPIFGVIPPDSPFYTPILGFFAIGGLPTAGFLFYKSIKSANKASEDADKEDGFRR